MKRTVQIISSLILFYITLVVAASYTIPVNNGEPVQDTAGILKNTEEIAAVIRSFRDKNPNIQISVLTIPSLEGAQIEQFAKDVINSWGGSRILLIVLPSDDQVALMVSHDLEGVLPDSLLATVVKRSAAVDYERPLLIVKRVVMKFEERTANTMTVVLQNAQPEPETVKQPEPETVKQPEPETVKQPEPETVKQPEPETVKQPEPETVKQPEPYIQTATGSKSDERNINKKSSIFIIIITLICVALCSIEVHKIIRDRKITAHRVLLSVQVMQGELAKEARFATTRLHAIKLKNPEIVWEKYKDIDDIDPSKLIYKWQKAKSRINSIYVSKALLAAIYELNYDIKLMYSTCADINSLYAQLSRFQAASVELFREVIPRLINDINSMLDKFAESTFDAELVHQFKTVQTTFSNLDFDTNSNNIVWSDMYEILSDIRDELTRLLYALDNKEAVKEPSNKKAVKEPSNKKAVKEPSNKEAVKAPSNKKAVKEPSNKKAVKAPSNKKAVKAPSNKKAVKAPSNKK